MGGRIVRRRFLKMMSGMALAGAAGAEFGCAQQSSKVPRVAYVYIFKEGPSRPFEKEFRASMTQLGWVDGRNVQILVRDADGSNERLDVIMRDLVESRVDVIVAACTPEGKAASKYTKTIPIVMAATGDAVASGLAVSFSHPGGNVTGMSAMLLDQSAKRMELLKEAFPAITKAAVIWNPDRPDNHQEVRAMQNRAKDFGVTLESVQVRTVDEIVNHLAMLDTQAILNAGDTLTGANRDKLIAYAARMRIPGLYEDRVYTEQGGLMSYGPDLATLQREAAGYVDKILKGATPGELAIKQPKTFDLVINLRTAKALGYTFPPSILARVLPANILT
jgi:putative ABC transport system substrate-binding protein